MKILQFKSVTFWIVILIVPLKLTGLCFGENIVVVAPNGLEHADGTSSSQTRNLGFKHQWLYPASDFASLPDGGALIIGHTGRADRDELVADTDTFADIQLTLSTTNLDELGNTFANNRGGDATVVFDGTRSIFYPVSDPGGGPQPWGSSGDYQDPFFYDPSLGNLLVELLTFSGKENVDPRLRDWHDTGPNRTLSSGLPTATRGTLRDRVRVHQFTIVTELTGDLNGDGEVNFGDLTPFALGLTDIPAYEAMNPDVDRVAAGDVDMDGAFNFDDLAPFVAQLNPQAPGSVTVPEPTTWALSTLVILPVLLLRLRVARL